MGVSKKLSQTRVTAKPMHHSQHKKLEGTVETGQLPCSRKLMALAAMLKGCYSDGCSRAAHYSLGEKETLQMQTTGAPTIITWENRELFKDTSLSHSLKMFKLKSITGI